MKKDIFIHPTAIVSPKAKIGSGTKIWAFAQIRENARIGKDCMIGNGAYIDKDVIVCNRVNIHNRALLYRNLTVQDDVFIGPDVCFVNDPRPRANVIKNVRGLRGIVKKGATVGAKSCILSCVTIGRYAMVGAASLVSKNVPDQGLVYGSPAVLKGFVSKSGLKKKSA